MAVVFLYKIIDSDDRDCVQYIDKKAMKFECGHYFSRVHLCGACFCNDDWEDYDKIKTVLTRDEYERLIEFDRKIGELGFGITKGDERYRAGVALCESVQDIYDKLNGEENEKLFAEVWEEEKEYLYDEYGLDEDNIEEIIGEYPLAYRDRAIIGCVYDDAYDCGEEEAINLGYVSYGDTSSPQYKYFDFEQFGNDLTQDENYCELSDGRIVCFNC